MHLPRLYTPDNLAQGETLDLSGQAAHHVTNVLRLKAGATIHIFDGQGHEHRASISTVYRSDITLTVHEAVNGRMQAMTDIAIGLVPTGSGNDFAKACGIDTDWRIAAASLAARINHASAST